MKKHLLAMLIALSPVLALPASAFADDQDPDAVAQHLENDAVRNENRGDYAGAAEARDAADRAAHSDADGARDVERDYNRGD